MKIDGIQSLEYLSKILESEKSTEKLKEQLLGEGTDAVSFSDILSDEIANLKEFSVLSDTLGDTVLGSMAGEGTYEDLSTLADDLLHTGGGNKVLTILADAQLKAQIFDDGTSEKSEESMFFGDHETISGLTSKRMEEMLEKMEAIIEKLDE